MSARLANSKRFRPGMIVRADRDNWGHARNDLAVVTRISVTGGLVSLKFWHFRDGREHGWAYAEHWHPVPDEKIESLPDEVKVKAVEALLAEAAK